MTQARISEQEAWLKCLTYTRAVFTRIHEVRTVASVHKLGSMLFDMMRTTVLLQAYGELGCICHPDVSSALVVAALQKEGNAVINALTKPKTKDPYVATNEMTISTLSTNLNNLMSNNLSWKT